jgi:predicted dehydrogenase
MDTQPLGVAIVGCGVIADSYFRDLNLHSDVVIVTGCFDLDPGRAEAAAEKYGCRAFSSLGELLASDSVDIVVNLTIFQAHYEVTRACLEAGRHVFSEKPLTTRYDQARELVALAGQKGVRLGCAPFTFLGEAPQTAAHIIRSGRLGAVRVAYAEVNWGRIESWHPAPVPFYEIGPLYDVGVYPLAILASIFGPARRVWSYGRVLYPARTTKRGVPFTVETPDFGVTMVEYAGGPVARLTTNFYVTQQTRQTGIEFHGDVASLYLSNWHSFRAEVALADFNEPYEPAPYLQEPVMGMDWGLGVADMARAIQAGEPHRASGELAAHIVEILEAASLSMQHGHAEPVNSTFPAPAPMPWATLAEQP